MRVLFTNGDLMLLNINCYDKMLIIAVYYYYDSHGM